MSGIETHGGACPKCLKSMMQKWESSGYGFMFDACPWCGFAYATQDSQEVRDNEAIWESILGHHGFASRSELIQAFKIEEYTPEENKEFFPSVFDHSKDEGVQLFYQLLWKKESVFKDGSFNISGLRVSWNEDGSKDDKQEGTVMGYKEGKVCILWDEHKGSKLPYFEYPATDVGNKIQLITSIAL